jgi:subtilase family serine protease
MLNRTAAQQADLERFLADQLSPSSPDYHNWLTPEQFADRFSLSADDFEKVTAWLTWEGFAVDYAGRGRNWILFSGSAAQVESTFQTHMRRYLFDGEMRYANAWEPSVPEAIAPLIGYLSLNDFPMTGKKPGPRPVVRFEAAFGTPTTNLTDGSHVVTPGDLATIYNVNPLYQMGLDGSGIKMAIVGVSDIHISDMQDFRTQFGLPQNDPQVILVEGSTDPGYNDGEGEADLDLQYAGGLAPKATLLYVNSTSPVNSALYAVQQNLAPIISMSFQGCEQLITSQPLQFADAYRQLAQQANAQGITWMVSSGDAGAAACDMGGVKLAVNGLDVNVLASVPEVTGVGGTMFNEGNGNYWSPTGNSDYSSALSYIPESTWNDTATMGTIWASGGGVSTSYSKPSWQTGAGVPNDQARDVPDVSLFASGHDAYFVMTQGKFGGVMGTSAACPSFAGMVALLNQYLLSTGKITKPGLSNINPNLYHLAAVNPGVYHDVTVGTNIVPCTTGTKDCTTGQIGYRAGPGYDLVTGLGSVDALSRAEPGYIHDRRRRRLAVCRHG